MKAIVFDLDNTLIDFLKMKRICCTAAVEAMIGSGLKLEREKALKILFEIYDEFGMEYDRVFQEFLKRTNGKVDYKILAIGVVAYRKAQLGQIEPYPNVVPTLIKLREKGLKLAILTDAPTIKAWIRLVEMRIHDYFNIVVTFEDTGKHKPSPEPFMKVLSELKLRPEEVLMVGDWPERDVKGAKNVGMKTCFAAYGNMKMKHYPGADYEINNFKELLEVVKNAKD